MKRIIFYAAAAGIFISSVLAKPARGAVPGYAANGRCGGTDIWDSLQDRLGAGSCRDLCRGSGWDLAGGSGWDLIVSCGWNPGCAQIPSGGDNGCQNAGGTQGPAENMQGAEWFPGQGPDSADQEKPGSQVPGAEWFPGQGPDSADQEKPGSQVPGAEWFPGQGPDNAGQGKPGNQLPGGNAGGNQNGSQGDRDPGSQLPGGSQGGGQSDSSRPGDTDAADSYITRITELVNIQRAAAGLSPVTASSVLSAAADVRAREIVSNFSHYRPNGTYFNTVLDQRGISYNGAGENIAYGYDTPERVMTEWMNSAGHRANILDARYTKLGVGYYTVGGVKYWTQLFTY